MENFSLRLTNYWLVLCKRKRIVLFSFLVIFLSVFISMVLQPPVYLATCSISYIGNKSVADIITSTNTHVPFKVTNSVLRALADRSLIGKAVYDSGLIKPGSSAREVKGVVLSIQDAASTESDPLTGLINISVQHKEANMAAKIANALAKAYIKNEVEKNSERASNNRINIEEQDAASKAELFLAEEALNKFKEQQERTTGIATAIQNNIATLEEQRIEIINSVAATHPDALKINEQIEGLKRELGSLSGHEIEFAELTKKYESAEKTHRLLQSRLEDARLAEAAKQSDFKVFALAKPPRTSLKPYRNKVIVIGLISGLLLGVLAAFVAETFKSKNA